MKELDKSGIWEYKRNIDDEWYVSKGELPRKNN